MRHEGSMYNFIMSSQASAWDGAGTEWSADRFYAPQEYKDSLKVPFTQEQIEWMKSLPTLFTVEFNNEVAARVGWLNSIECRSHKIRLGFSLDNEIPPIPIHVLKDLAWQLDIDTTNHHHWTIKGVDLMSELSKAGLLKGAKRLRPEEFKFRKKTVLAACDVFSQRLTQAQMSRLLVEVDTEEVPSNAPGVSVAKRAGLLASFALNKPEHKTASELPLPYYLVKEAAKAEFPYLTHDDLRFDDFWDSLRSDGWAFRNGEFQPVHADVPSDPVGERPYSFPPINTVAPVNPKPTGDQFMRLPGKPKVFIVHGRDNSTKHDVANFLSRLGVEPVILHERPNAGRTLIAKFQEESADIQFAVVLITPDDVGGLDQGPLHPRARQNVVFELGFFIGRLGPGKVCALVKGQVETPSDFDAVVYVPYGDNTDWKRLLARELDHAGVTIDHKGLL